MEFGDARAARQQALARQYEFLTRQKGAAFIIQLWQWWRFIAEDPMLRGLVDDALEEAKALLDRFQKHEISMADELIAVRNEMIVLHPPLDDSEVPKPDGRSLRAATKYESTLAYFDEVAVAAKAPGPVRLSVVGMDDDSAAKELLKILLQKCTEAQDCRKREDGSFERVEENLAPALDGILLKLSDARGRLRLIRSRGQVD